MNKLFGITLMAIGAAIAFMKDEVKTIDAIIEHKPATEPIVKNEIEVPPAPKA